jgi:uncharacterized DUF497 family protein
MKGVTTMQELIDLEERGWQALSSEGEAGKSFYSSVLHNDAVIGLDRRWTLLYVVHIELENDIIRIISARKATRKEHDYYES